MELLAAITDWVVFASILPFLGFMFFYDRGGIKRKNKIGKGPWRKSAEGRTIMTQKFVLASLMVYVLALRILGDFEGEEWVKLAVYTGLGATAWVMFINLLKIYKDVDRKEDTETK